MYSQSAFADPYENIFHWNIWTYFMRNRSALNTLVKIGLKESKPCYIYIRVYAFY